MFPVNDRKYHSDVYVRVIFFAVYLLEDRSGQGTSTPGGVLFEIIQDMRGGGLLPCFQAIRSGGTEPFALTLTVELPRGPAFYRGQ